MAKNTTQNIDGQAASPEVAKENMVKVRFTKNATRAAGCIWALGAVTPLPEGEARTLAGLGYAVIIGV